MSALFERVLGGAAFSTLPHRVQALHRAGGSRVYRGGATVESGNAWLARCCARAALLPRTSGEVPVTVEIAADGSGERWSRAFGAQRMPSRLWSSNGLLCERLGAVTFAFALSASGGVLRWQVRRVRALGLPLPARWFRGVSACESEADGRYRFEVEARLPLAGLLVRYAGWLDV